MIRFVLLLCLLCRVASADTWTCRTESVEPGGMCFVWRTEGGLKFPTLIPDGWSVDYPANYSIGDWHRQWAWRIKVSPKAPPGKYDIGGVAVTVVKPAKRREVRTASKGSSLSVVRKRLAEGYDVELAPGVHVWGEALSVPDGATIFSHGAIVIRKPNGDYAERMFVPQGSMTLDGLTLAHDESIDWPTYIHAYPTPPGRITVRHCVLRGGELIRCYSPDAYVYRTRFDRAGSGQVPPTSVWEACEFTGHTRQGQHAWFNTGSEGGLVFGGLWRNTNRGMVFQTGSSRGWMVLDSDYESIRGGESNANEVILLEGGVDGQTKPGDGIRDNTFLDLRLSNCSGPGISLYGSGMSGNTFWGVDIQAENTGITVVALRGGQHGANEFHNVQSNCGLDFRGDIGRVTLSNVTLIEEPQRRGNQGPFEQNYKYFNEYWPIYLDDVAKAKGKFTMSGCGVLRGRKYEPITAVP